MVSRDLEYAKEDLDLIKEFYGKELVIICGCSRVKIPEIMRAQIVSEIEKYLLHWIEMEEMYKEDL